MGATTAYTLDVLAQTGEAASGVTYTINVHRPSTDTSLAFIGCGYCPVGQSVCTAHTGPWGLGGAAAAISGSGAGDMNFDVTFDSMMNVTTATAVPNHHGATVTIDGVPYSWDSGLSTDGHASCGTKAGTAINPSGEYWIHPGCEGQDIALTAGGTVIITVVVTAQDLVSQTTYRIHAFRPSPDASLSSLAPTGHISIGGVLSPSFDPGTLGGSYTLTVLNSIAEVFLTPIATFHTGVTILIADSRPAVAAFSCFSNGSMSSAIALDEGGTVTLTLTVTAQDGTTTADYTLAVARMPSTNSKLAQLNIRGYFSSSDLDYDAADPTQQIPVSFSPSMYSYSHNFDNSIQVVKLIALCEHSEATILVYPNTYELMVINGGSGASYNKGNGGQPFSSGSFMPLAEGGVKDYGVVVTAQDGSTSTYRVFMNRAPSSNALLDTLIPTPIAAFYPPWVSASNLTAYSVGLSELHDSVSFVANPVHSGASIIFAGTPLAPGGSSALVPIGNGLQGTVTIVVTAQDGVTSISYVVTISRPRSTNSDLSGLLPHLDGVSASVFDGGFGTGIISYTQSVANSYVSYSLTATTDHPDAAVSVNGSPVASGSSSAAYHLVEGGETLFVVLVTAQDYSYKYYNVTVTRAKSVNARLSSLVPNYSPGGGGAPASFSEGLLIQGLVPAFSYQVTSYDMNVSNSVTEMTLTPSKQHWAASITVSGFLCASGNESGTLALPDGSSSHTVDLLAQDPSPAWGRTYTVIVNRALSSNAHLSSIVPFSGSFSAPFHSGTTSYRLQLPNERSTINVTAITDYPLSTMTLKVGSSGSTVAQLSGASSPNIPLLEGGDTSITFVITSQNGLETRSYVILVSRAPSTNADLAFLQHFWFTYTASSVEHATTFNMDQSPSVNTPLTAAELSANSSYAATCRNKHALPELIASQGDEFATTCIRSQVVTFLPLSHQPSAIRR